MLKAKDYAFQTNISFKNVSVFVAITTAKEEQGIQRKPWHSREVHFRPGSVFGQIRVEYSTLRRIYNL